MADRARRDRRSESSWIQGPMIRRHWPRGAVPVGLHVDEGIDRALQEDVIPATHVNRRHVDSCCLGFGIHRFPERVVSMMRETPRRRLVSISLAPALQQFLSIAPPW